MRVFFALTLILALNGCAAPASATQTPTTTPVPTLAQTPIPVGETPTETVAPSPKGTFPAEMSCPASETVCIVPGHFLFQRPLDSSANQTIDRTYSYGATQDGKREPHHGVDFPNAQGTSVLAAGTGQVVVAGNDKLALYGPLTSFYGNLVVIEHPLPGVDGAIYTLYGHLFKVNAQVGQSVQAGDKIGEVGATGIAIGSHLHLEVRITNNDYRSSRNPELWVQPLPGMGALAGRVVDAQGSLVKATITIQRVENDAVILLYPIETYPRESLNSDDVLQENFVVGDLAAGQYRLTLIYNGQIYEQRVQIVPGKLTVVEFRL